MIQPEQFGLSGDDFTPVRLFDIGGAGAIGTIDYAVEELGLPSRFADAQVGFALTFPAPLAPGETISYTIQWGKVVHMGWEDNTAVPELNNTDCGTNKSNIIQFAASPYLDASERYQRLESKAIFHVDCLPPTDDGYLFQRIFGAEQLEIVLELVYHPAEFQPDPNDPTPSYFGTRRRYRSLKPGFVETPFELWTFWEVEERVENLPPVQDRDFTGFAFQRFNKSTLNPIGNPFTSELIEDDSWNGAARATDGYIWLLAETADDRLVYSKVSPSGQLVADRATLATHAPDLTNPGFVQKNLLSGSDGRLWFFYSRDWTASASNGETRMEIYVKVLNADGTTACPERRLGPPAADPNAPFSENRFFSWTPLVNQDGKVWFSYGANINGTLSFYYSILNEDCTLFRDNVPIAEQRQFRFSDSDGHVWMIEGGQLTLLNPDDTPAHDPWPGSALIPNQAHAIRAAQVRLDGFRIFDRWSAQAIEVVVPPSTTVDVMELIDVDKFGQDAHVEDLKVCIGAWCESIPGVAPPTSNLNIAGILGAGLNVANLTQSNLVGGELIITFPSPFCVVDPPATPVPTTHAGQAKNRSLSIVPTNPGKQTALRVTLTSSSTFPGDVGKQWWVAAPTEICENSGEGPATLPANCGPAPGLPKKTMWSSALTCSQICLDWNAQTDISGNALDVLHISDPGIVTGSTYTLEAIDCECDPQVPGNYSTPLVVDTSRWGDLSGGLPSDCPRTGPDTSVDLILDCVAVLNKFSNMPCAMLKARVDIEPQIPDLAITIADVLRCVNAFSGDPYPFPAPVGCP